MRKPKEMKDVLSLLLGVAVSAAVSAGPVSDEVNCFLGTEGTGHTFLRHADIENGGELVFEMTDSPAIPTLDLTGGRQHIFQVKSGRVPVSVSTDGQLVVAAPGVERPARVRYLREKAGEGFLYSVNSGLPVGPFESAVKTGE